MIPFTQQKELQEKDNKGLKTNMTNLYIRSINDMADSTHIDKSNEGNLERRF